NTLVGQLQMAAGTSSENRDLLTQRTQSSARCSRRRVLERQAQIFQRLVLEGPLIRHRREAARKRRSPGQSNDEWTNLQPRVRRHQPILAQARTPRCAVHTVEVKGVELPLNDLTVGVSKADFRVHQLQLASLCAPDQ